MKKLISRVCCLCCVVLVLAACLPFSAFAVDPVSAGVMANAFAQAIAAYGASNGVAMTFDVTSTNGIGETVHELWKDFREGTQDADDYATLAAALFPDLYYKASSVVGGVADVYTVGYNISSTYAEEFDNFFDWLLSGPAEMVKVDNQYYQFAQSQVGSSAVPIQVTSINTSPFVTVPVLSSASNLTTEGLVVASTGSAHLYCGANRQNIFVCSYVDGGFVYYTCFCSSNSFTAYFKDGSNSTRTTSSSSDSGINRASYSVLSSSPYVGLVPSYSSKSDAITAFKAWNEVSSFSTVGVKASTNTGVAQFPDTTDPNYEAVGKQIPSTVPWDNTAYGDGTGTLTDAQAGAIAAGADTAIARDGVLDLAGTDEVTDEPGVDDPPTTDPDDYAVPGLAEIFPFCIPFDIYNFLSALAANPVAPHFTATLDFPEAVGGTQTIDIDFDSPTWNQLAQLLRLLELLAFIIGLALLTRSMFIRG